MRQWVINYYQWFNETFSGDQGFFAYLDIYMPVVAIVSFVAVLWTLFFYEERDIVWKIVRTVLMASAVTFIGLIAVLLAAPVLAFLVVPVAAAVAVWWMWERVL